MKISGERENAANFRDIDGLPRLNCSRRGKRVAAVFSDSR